MTSIPHQIEETTVRSYLTAIAAGSDDVREVQNDFIAVASAFSGREKISYKAWRYVGVPDAILRRAGITP